jgi:hypothetical protein
VAILRAVCPGCGAGLKCTDPAGFTAGEALTCPKCDTSFKVKATAVAARPVAAKPAARKPQVVDDDEDDRPKKKAVKAAAADDDDDEDDDRPRKKRPRDDDEDDDRPRKKKRKADRDEGGGYRNSPVRFIVLGILVTIMLVLAVLLYLKWQNEKQDAAAPAARVTAV